MAFFKGQETYSIDSKNRVAIPVKMRKAMSEEAEDTFNVTLGSEGCIAAYPMDEWKKYQDKFSHLNQFNEKTRFFLRTLLQWSEDAVLDGQQRILLPKQLTEQTGIKGKILIVGMIDHLEFWDPEKYSDYMNGHNQTYESVAAEVMSAE
ncbi:MAG: division/cell wall cluster transcriptional repressor MraZ [Candidatus Kapabacteria bacterium]|nr:division/cell wall cluster transcriptional repressor MraZ [Candidatus Kapabacteria bacterium]